MSVCRACGSEIRWARHHAHGDGGRVAVDADPTPGGSIELVVELGDANMYLVAQPVRANERLGRDDLRALHARTCAGVRERVAS